MRKTHGVADSRTWKAWHNMRQRVMCPSNRDYKRYKDLFIDPEWHVFANFYNDMGECPVGMTLDRKDNNKGYLKNNCQWATRKQQARNRGNNKLSVEIVRNIKASLGTVPGYLLAKEYGVTQATICDIKYGRIWQEVNHV